MPVVIDPQGCSHKTETAVRPLLLLTGILQGLPDRLIVYKHSTIRNKCLFASHLCPLGPAGLDDTGPDHTSRCDI